jgi:wyosine [tRNA(Phe)-imidazoG37] synthetase (radical SAM superfamily)
MTSAALAIENPSQPLVQSIDGLLHVNILGQTKVCAFDCAYCDRGATSLRLNRIKKDVIFPTPEEISQGLSSFLRELGLRGSLNGGLNSGQPDEALSAIRIYGNGDPTLHPDFAEVIQAIMAAKGPWGANLPVEVVTSGANIDQRKVFEALNRVDRRIVKIDAGNEKLFKALNAPRSRTTLSRVIAGARNLVDHLALATFVKGAYDNTSNTDLDDWIEVIGMMRPRQVQLTTVSGVALAKASRSGVEPCDEDTLYVIASKLERKTQIKSLVIVP